MPLATLRVGTDRAAAKKLVGVIGRRYRPKALRYSRNYLIWKNKMEMLGKVVAREGLEPSTSRL